MRKEKRDKYNVDGSKVSGKSALFFVEQRAKIRGTAYCYKYVS